MFLLEDVVLFFFLGIIVYIQFNFFTIKKRRELREETWRGKDNPEYTEKEGIMTEKRRSQFLRETYNIGSDPTTDRLTLDEQRDQINRKYKKKEGILSEERHEEFLKETYDVSKERIENTEETSAMNQEEITEVKEMMKRKHTEKEGILDGYRHERIIKELYGKVEVDERINVDPSSNPTEFLEKMRKSHKQTENNDDDEDNGIFARKKENLSIDPVDDEDKSESEEEEDEGMY